MPATGIRQEPIIQDENRTILISSHILSDVEKVIDHTLIMQQGRILRDCSFDDLREEYLRVTLTSLNGDLPAVLPFEHIVDCQTDGHRAVLTVRGISPDQLAQQVRALHCEAESRTLSLEEIYKAIIG